MLTEVRLGEYLVEIDQDATREWYAKAEGWSCSCGDCRNFLALAMARRLPEPVLSLLDPLGIPPEKATYVYSLTKDQEKGILYDFSYRIAGKILQGDLHTRDKLSCYHETYPYGAPDFPEPHFDLGFCDWLPWELE